MGVMDRLILDDTAWARIAPLIIGRPDVFGEWNRVFRRFSRWSRKGVWWRIFAAMSDDSDFEYRIIDPTIVRAHQHAAGAKKGGLKMRPMAAPEAA